MRATVNDKSKSTSPAPKARKSKFQADLAPSEDSIVRALKAELQMTSNTDFLSDAPGLVPLGSFRTEARSCHRQREFDGGTQDLGLPATGARRTCGGLASCRYSLE